MKFISRHMVMLPYDINTYHKLDDWYIVILKNGKFPYCITVLYGNDCVTICQAMKYMAILPYNINTYH